MWNGSAVASMDVLGYSYKSSGGNDQLMQVTDANGGGGTYGFKNQSGDAEHYLYDENGNLIQDKNKNMTSIFPYQNSKLSMKKKELLNRWKSSEGMALLKLVLTALKKKQFVDSGFTDSGGYLQISCSAPFFPFFDL